MSIVAMELSQILSDPDDYFAAGHVKVYYSPKQIKSEDFRGPITVLNRLNQKTFAVPTSLLC